MENEIAMFSFNKSTNSKQSIKNKNKNKSNVLKRERLTNQMK